MQQQQQPSQNQSSMQTGMPPQQQFGGLEIMEAHESLGALSGCIAYYSLHQQYVQDQQLTNIFDRQKTFVSQLYNTVLNTLQTGKDPAVKTQTYEMQENNQTTYGVTPSTPKAPIQNVNEINDKELSSALLGHLKGIASHFTMAALESTNPVLRRIFADSVPNVIELAFEVYLYQNKQQYYQVPQLTQQDTQAIISHYGPVPGNMPH